jgi:hypothetical protein
MEAAASLEPAKILLLKTCVSLLGDFVSQAALLEKQRIQTLVLQLLINAVLHKQRKAAVQCGFGY